MFHHKRMKQTSRVLLQEIEFLNFEIEDVLNIN